MTEQPENHIEYLFSAALKKCGNIPDAEDLTQETLLAAYMVLHRGQPISNMKSWLISTMHHKFYDMLRRKYKLPTISIDVPQQILPEEPVFQEEFQEDAADEPTPEQIRRETAYLARLHREVIVRHYLAGQKVQQIADALGIPKGTVLSRLSSGREQMRKGLEQMNSYDKLSYAPEHLDLGCHGCPGLHDEPWSLISDDLLRQNILIAAYEAPVTCVEIARTLGIPTSYIESAVEYLLRSELMCRSGNKVFTDFMMTSPEQELDCLDSQITFAEEHYAELTQILQNTIEDLRKFCWYEHLDERARACLEYYCILAVFSSGIYTAAQRLVPVQEEFPDRPDGGSWIAVGHRYPLDFDFSSYRCRKYSCGGERHVYYDQYLNRDSISLHIYDAQPDLNKYQHGPMEMQDDDLCKLLYLIKEGIEINTTDFNALLLKNIPHLAECGILKLENGKPRTAIPVISKEDYTTLKQLCMHGARQLADILEKPFGVLFPSIKINLPPHLEGRITPIRQYPCFYIPMAFMKKAIGNGDFWKGITMPLPPMVLVI